MSQVYIDGGKLPIKAWVSELEGGRDSIESSALQQLRNVADLPFVHKHVAVMPDVHAGKGATIGSVIATRGAIIPAAVGVDLGCGLSAVRTDLTASDLPDDLRSLRTAIESNAPHGRTDNGGKNDRGQWGDIPDRVAEAYAATKLPVGFKSIVEKHQKFASWEDRLVRGIGTLGTGNHFVEVSLDEEDRVWVVLHSGSRGVGNAIGSYFIDIAKEDMRKWFINLPDADLSYMPEGTDHFNDYWYAVLWAQEYALLNRNVMMSAALAELAGATRPLSADLVAVNCHHNYVALENHFGSNVYVTRKGAVRARAGDLGVIPGSMGAQTFIVSGLGSADSFCSCSHGAGRKMSRTAAKKAITLEMHAEATAGIECRKDADVLDESPAAYKDIGAVMRSQSDLVSIVHTLRAVVNVKG